MSFHFLSVGVGESGLLIMFPSRVIAVWFLSPLHLQFQQCQSLFCNEGIPLPPISAKVVSIPNIGILRALLVTKLKGGVSRERADLTSPGGTCPMRTSYMFQPTADSVQDSKDIHRTL